MRAGFGAVAALWAVGFAAGAQGACVLEARWSPQAPYWVAQPDPGPSGYLAEALRELARRRGCELRFVEMPWARGIAEMRAGRVDLMAGAVRTPEREAFAWFSRPMNRSPVVLVLRASVPRTVRIPTLAALAETTLSIGVQPGAVYSAEYGRLLDDPRFAARLHPVSRPKNAWKMLEEGRLDGLLTDEVSAITAEAESGGRLALRQALVVSTEPSRLMVGRYVGLDTAVALDATLGAMIEDGYLPRLRDAWIACTTDPATMGCAAAATPAKDAGPTRR